MATPPKTTRRPPLKPRKKPEYSPEARERMRANGQRLAASKRNSGSAIRPGTPEAALAESLGLASAIAEPVTPKPEPIRKTPRPATRVSKHLLEPVVDETVTGDLARLDPKLRLEMAKRVLARRSLVQFTKRFYPQYNPGWVHHDIARRLEKFMKDVEDKKSPRLMLLVPPRHGKSELVSIRFPAFVLGHHPEWEVINCGYNLDLPMKFSRKVREIARDPGYKPLFERAQLDPDSQSAEAWNTTAGGGFTAAGVGGGITGKGATVLIIDDPIKNQEEADSITTRDGLWDWYWSTAYSRLAPGGGVLLVQCMVGDTPVLIADGGQRRLDSLVRGDEIATFDQGVLTTSKIAAIKSNGRDAILEITTISGKVVRANGRHPFLVALNGELRWIRARSLTTAHKIVAQKGSGVNGKESLVQQMAATSLLSVAGSCATTATQESDILGLSPWHLPQPDTYDFTLDEIVSIRPAGEEEVFDLQVERTENFIANGLVSHNTWWHDDDLAGRLQQKMRHEADTDQFTIIKYPALAEKWEYRNKETDLIERYDSPLVDGHAVQRAERRNKGVTDPMPIDEKYDLLRAPGEALHPERYDEKMMNSMKANQTPRIWSALYQQNPVPDEGVYFRKEYFKYEPVSPIAYNRHVFQAWDFAIGEKQQNDYTVGVTLIQDENDFLHLVDVVRFKGDSFTIVEEMLDAAQRWGSEPTAPLMMGVEDSQIWKAIKPMFEKRMQERGMYPPYEVLKPLTDKLSRSRSLQGRMQQGRVYFPTEASWLGDVQTELLRFPAGAHDDIVDAMAWAVNLCIGRSPKKLAVPKPVKGWRDKLSQLTDGFFGEQSHMAS